MQTTYALSRSKDAGMKRVTYSYNSSVSGTFNSLFKVLCIFPSLYLFAIGLRAIFSLSRGTPADLFSTPKLNDSCRLKAWWLTVHSPYGALTLCGTPHSRRLRRVLELANWGLTYNSASAFTNTDSGLGFSLFTRRY